MEDNLIQYDIFASKHKAAYAAFKSIYQDKNPLPLLMKADRSDWYIAIGVSLIVVASVIVSGSRTIVEFGGGLVGVSAFVMLECAVVAFAFLYTKNNVNDERVSDVRKLTKRGMWLALTVAVVANIHAVLKQNGVISSEAINVFILLLVAVSAPLLAYISGDIAGLEYIRALNRTRKIDEQNRALMMEYNDTMNRSWISQQKQWGVKIEIESPVKSLSMNVHEQHGQAQKALTPGVIQAIEWLKLNDPHGEMTVREASMKASISTGTIGTAKKYIKDNPQ